MIIKLQYEQVWRKYFLLEHNKIFEVFLNIVHYESITLQ